MGITFEVLRGLPASDQPHVDFFRDGKSHHREGFVVRFNSDVTGAWVGNFQPGVSGISTVRMHPNGVHLLVIAGGDGYVIDADAKALVASFGGMISDVLPIPNETDLIFAEQVCIERYGVNGSVWQSERISWDGFRAMSVSADAVSGESYTPLGDCWIPFTVKLSDGSVDGGPYSEDLGS